VTLHDQAYNHDRNIATGNPYKKLVTDLVEQDVQVELCGATAKVHGWGNADIIPGIKINTDAMCTEPKDPLAFIFELLIANASVFLAFVCRNCNKLEWKLVVITVVIRIEMISRSLNMLCFCYLCWI
jgi:hypothetical protein